MAIYKRGDVYWYKFVWNGRHIRESAKTGNPRTARQIESARKTELAKGEVGIKDKPPAPTFEDFSKRFTAWLAIEKAEKPNTVAFYRDRVRQLLQFDKLRKALLDQIQEELISEYVQWRTTKTRKYALRKSQGTELADTFEPVSVACVNRDLATVRRMLNLARLWKVIPAVPIIKLLPGERGHERVLSHREESQYLGAAPLLLRQFATVMLDTGMRPEEVCRMSWEHAHLEPVNGARFGYVHNPSGKTKQAKRNLSLTARVQSLLSMRHEAAGKPATGWVFPANDDPTKHVPYSTIDSQHGRTIEKVNAPDDAGNKPENPIVPFRLYDLRHTFLTRLGEVNTDPFTIQRIAGHASITMSQRYVHPTPERLEDAFARLETYNQAKVSATPQAPSVPVN
jgi:integrase